VGALETAEGIAVLNQAAYGNVLRLKMSAREQQRHEGAGQSPADSRRHPARRGTRTGPKA